MVRNDTPKSRAITGVCLFFITINLKCLTCTLFNLNSEQLNEVMPYDKHHFATFLKDYEKNNSTVHQL